MSSKGDSRQALISEQIASASNEHEKYVAGELKERVRILKKELETKDRKLLQASKQHKHHDLEDGLEATNTIEYTDLTKATDKVFKENELLRKEIEVKDQEIAKQKEQKEELVKLNLVPLHPLRSSPSRSTNSRPWVHSPPRVSTAAATPVPPPPTLPSSSSTRLRWPRTQAAKVLATRREIWIASWTKIAQAWVLLN